VPKEIFFGIYTFVRMDKLPRTDLDPFRGKSKPAKAFPTSVCLFYTMLVVHCILKVMVKPISSL
jgi:hypothetical protein